MFFEKYLWRNSFSEMIFGRRKSIIIFIFNNFITNLSEIYFFVLLETLIAYVNRDFDLKEIRSSYLCITPYNHPLMFAMQKWLKKLSQKVIACFCNLVIEKYFKKKELLQFVISIMILLEIHQKSEGSVLKELCVSFILIIYVEYAKMSFHQILCRVFIIIQGFYILLFVGFI